VRTICGSSILWIGVAVVLFAIGPLLAVASRESGQPGWGYGGVILAFFVFCLGALLILLGLGSGIARFLGWIDRVRVKNVVFTSLPPIAADEAHRAAVAE
jgi:hypothetical protein